ncbi:MAG: hypothetical protein HGA38_01505 [Candidatus Moranbacteria bacterium]|nr:hypothetical protein [Candidatus Moranbacteria bacterium]
MKAKLFRISALIMLFAQMSLTIPGTLLAAPIQIDNNWLGRASQFPGGVTALLNASDEELVKYAKDSEAMLASEGIASDSISVSDQIVAALKAGNFETITVPENVLIPWMGSKHGKVTGKNGEGYLTKKPIPAVRIKVTALKDGKKVLVAVEMFKKCANVKPGDFGLIPDTTKTVPPTEPPTAKKPVIRFSIIAEVRGDSGAFAERTVGLGVESVDSETGRRNGFHAGVGIQARQSEVRKHRTETYTETRTASREVSRQITEEQKHSVCVPVNQYLEVDRPIDPAISVPAGKATVTVYSSDSGECRVFFPELNEQGVVKFYGENDQQVAGVGPTIDVPDNSTSASITSVFETTFSGAATYFLVDHAFSGNSDYAGNGFTIDGVQVDYSTMITRTETSMEDYTYQVQHKKEVSWTESKTVRMPYAEFGNTWMLGKIVDLDVTGTLALPGLVSSKMSYVRNGQNHDVTAIPGAKVSLPIYVSKKMAITPNVVSEFLVTPQEGTPNMTSVGVELNGIDLIGLNETIKAGVSRQIVNDLGENDWYANVRVEVPLSKIPLF